jgi:MFS transporter, MHS family, proline/betaine transporter
MTAGLSVPLPVLRRVVAAAALGNAMEWFDFGVYNYLAITIGRDPVTQQLAALGAFAAAFLVRPVGALVLGPLGDRIGRRAVLSFTMLLMTGSTFAIGLIPSHAQIGMAAPVLLLAARLVQGFSTGGEYGGAMIFIAEYAPPGRRGFAGSWLEFGTCGGFLLGALLAAALTSWLPPPVMDRWGWRVPFLLALPLGLIGLYIRTHLDETPAFQALARAGAPQPARWDWRQTLLCTALVVAFNVPDFVVLSYMPSYIHSTLGLPENQALIDSALMLALMMALVPVAGRLTDRIGGWRLILACCVLYLVLSVPCFLLIRTAGTGPILLGLAALGVALSGLIGAMPSTLPMLFPTGIRYGALAVTYSIAISAFGATSLPIITYLIRETGNALIPAYYLIGTAALGVAAALFMRSRDAL